MAKEGRSTERRINLAALRKQDPSVEIILDTASSVAHYKFDATTEKWEKTEFEGSMFLYKRSGLEVEVAFLIMNRLNKDNLIIKIQPGMEFKLQEPFLLCRTVSDIIGIWFYDVQECSRISALLSSIAQVSGNQEDLANLISKLTAEIERRETPKKDLMQLFMQAKEEYDKRGNQGDNFRKSTSMTKMQSKDQNMAACFKRNNSFSDCADENSTERDGLAMSAASSTIESNTLMKLLQAKRSTDKKPRSRTLSYGEQAIDLRAESSQNGQQSKAGELFLPLSNSRTNQAQYGNFERPKPINVAMLEAAVLMTSPTKSDASAANDDALRSQRKSENARSKSKTDSKERSSQLIESGDCEQGKLAVTKLMTPASITSGKPNASKVPSAGIGRGRGLASILNIADKKSDERTQMASTSTPLSQNQSGETVNKNTTPRKEPGLAMKFPDPPSSGLVSSLMSPMQFKAAQKSSTIPVVKEIENASYSTDSNQLSKQQFQDAFIHLLQNDDSFVDKLHTSYLNMLSRAKR